jgi:hypothetical protein
MKISRRGKMMKNHDGYDKEWGSGVQADWVMGT